MSEKCYTPDEFGQCLPDGPKTKFIDRDLHYNVIKAELDYFKGKILTIIDASFSDEIQRKAVKDLVHQAFDSEQRYFWKITHKEEYGSGSQNNVGEKGSA